MLIGFKKEDFEAVKEVAKGLNLPLTVFAEVSENKERFPCRSHHFTSEIMALCRVGLPTIYFQHTSIFFLSDQ